MLTILRINWDLWLDGPCAKNDKRLDPAWQAMRLELFRRYTLPSLARQTHGDWRAWVRCDPDLRPLHGPLAAACGQDPRVRICYNADVDARDLAANPGETYERILFGRIDSDDMLAPRALERWGQAAESIQPGGDQDGFVQFADGYAWDAQGKRLFEWNHFSVAILARVCGRADFAAGLPPLGGNHGQVHEYARRIDDARHYCVVLHGDNLCNQVRSRWVGPEIAGDRRTRIMREFGI